MEALIVLAVVAVFVIVTLTMSVKIVPQARAGVVETASSRCSTFASRSSRSTRSR